MAFYPQFPAIYAYHPMYSQQEYAMYHPAHAGVIPAEMAAAHQPVYYGQPNQPHHHMYSYQPHASKPGYNNRKFSADSGISDALSSQASSRKTSNTSTISNSSLVKLDLGQQEKQLEEAKEAEEAELPPMEEPDDELCEKIVQQVEFYFSDANITKDKFLLKHVKRNKEGFVSLKLISSFKRVKHLTKDWRQVAFAVEKMSDKLEVNDLKTKVRRVDELPEFDQTSPSRTVVALNLPLERPTIEAVAEIFSVCGEIVLVRILRPGNPVPADIKPFANKHPEMSGKVCALIEFERTEFAQKAVQTLNSDEEEKMKVMELTAAPVKAHKKEERKKSQHGRFELYQQQQQPQQQYHHQRRFSHAGLTPPEMSLGGPRRRISLFHNMKFASIQEKKHEEDGEIPLNPNAPAFHMQMRPAPHHPALIDGFPMQAAPWMMRRFDMGAPTFGFAPNMVRGHRGHHTERRNNNGGGFQKWCKNRMETNSTTNTAKKPEKPPSRAVPIVDPSQEEREELEKAKQEEKEHETQDEKVIVDVEETSEKTR